MQTFRSPLVGSYNQRSFVTPSGKDQLFKACIFNRVVNSATNTATWYTEKRSGLSAIETLNSGKVGYGAFQLGSSNFGLVVSLYALDTPSIIYGDKSVGATQNLGTITGVPNGFYECTFGSTSYALIVSSDGTGWYLASDAPTATAYTCDGNNSTTITDIKIAGVNSTAGLYPGQKLTAASNIVAGSRVVSVNSGAFTAVLDTATTGGAFNDLATTKEPIAKMNDADFPSGCVGNFTELDGYVFVMTSAGKVYNSDLNVPYTWTSGNVIPKSILSDFGRGCIRYRNYIVAFGGGSMEAFYNAGNPTGSPLSAAPQLNQNVGCYLYPIMSGNTLFFISQNFSQKYSLAKLDGFTPVEITSEGIDFSAASLATLTSFAYAGQNIVNIGGSNSSYWYSVQNNVFVEPSLPAYGYFSGSNSLVICALSDTVGKSYQLSFASPTFQDNGSAFTMSIQIATDMGTDKRKFGIELRILADNQASGNIAISWSDDDGATFSTAINVPLTSTRKMLTGVLGSWEGTRLWKFEDSGNNADRIKQIEIDYTVAA